jgi:uncharacterized protein YdaU (DUF1376 family)
MTARKSARTDTWMPFYVADYLADTPHLTTEQHGAYLLLLMAAWKSEGRIDADDESLSQITRLPMDVWLRHKAKLLRFFGPVEDGLIAHKRVMAERKKARAVSAVRTAVSQLGVAARRKQKAIGQATGAASGDANGRPPDDQSGDQLVDPRSTQSQSHSQLQENPRAAATGKHYLAREELPPPPPPHAPAGEAGRIDPIHARAIEITVLLRRGGAALNAAHPTVREWAAKGVTDGQLLTTLERAQQRRHDKGDASPINAGFLNTILGDVREQRPAIDFDQLARELEER